MDASSFWGFAGVPFITGLLQIIKPFIPDERLWPLAAIVMGVILNLGVAYGQQGLYLEAGLLGIAVGMAASGFYTNGKNLINALRRR